MTDEFYIDLQFRLLVVVVNRGKGSKVMQYVTELGLYNACCFLGKGNINSHALRFMELSDVNKEVVFAILCSEKEKEILEDINQRFNTDKPNCFMAFTISLAGIMDLKYKSGVRWHNIDSNHNGPHAIFVISEKGKGQKAIELYYGDYSFGGIIIKARGSASEFKITLDMHVEPEKEAVLIVTESNRIKELVTLLNKELDLEKESTGVLVVLQISRTIGFCTEEQEVIL